MTMYAVFDIETTGLNPRHDRIVEIAVIVVTEAGNRIDEWETLINPRRDIGAFDIHGLTGTDLHSAPKFEELLPELSTLFSGRVPVSHNLSFDWRFLAAEFERAGHPLELDPECGLCTMRLANRYLSTPSVSLAACSASIGYEMEAAHAALADARAAARLLTHYISAETAFASSWRHQIEHAQRLAWPNLQGPPARRVNRQLASGAQQVHFLDRLAMRVPQSQIHPEASSYLQVLNRALLDRKLSLHEQDELFGAALCLGLSREDALGLHRRYLSSLCRSALSDGVVTESEREMLLTIAHALGLSSIEVEAGLQAVPATSHESTGAFERQHLRIGSTVVFTGEVSGNDRHAIEYQAMSMGLRVVGAVSRKTDLVVAADPDSISGKARKARELGIPIVDYQSYFRMLDVLHDNKGH